MKTLRTSYSLSLMALACAAGHAGCSPPSTDHPAAAAGQLVVPGGHGPEVIDVSEYPTYQMYRFEGRWVSVTGVLDVPNTKAGRLWIASQSAGLRIYIEEAYSVNDVSRAVQGPAPVGWDRGAVRVVGSLSLDRYGRAYLNRDGLQVVPLGTALAIPAAAVLQPAKPSVGPSTDVAVKAGGATWDYDGKQATDDFEQVLRLRPATRTTAPGSCE